VPLPKGAQPPDIVGKPSRRLGPGGHESRAFWKVHFPGAAFDEEGANAVFLDAPMRDVATLERICRDLPKADLHLHLDGSVRPKTLVELSEKGLRKVDLASAERKMRVSPDNRSLVDYLTRFSFVNTYLQTPEALGRVTRELVADCAAENVRIAEIRFCPLLHTLQGASPEAILAGVLDAFAAASKEHNLKGGIIVCALREQPADSSQQLAELAVKYKDKGVIALDLAGNEADHGTKNVLLAFDAAGNAGLRRIAHAGEADGPESIRSAIDVLKAERIGHGTRLLGDAKLTAEIAQRGIPLEVCLTSNVQTRAVSDYATHPFCRYLRAGVRVTINTDNRTVSNTNSSHELALAWFYGELTRDELKKLVLNGAAASFITADEKTAAHEEFESGFEAVLAKVRN